MTGGIPTRRDKTGRGAGGDGLADFKGTILRVTNDRYLLDKVVERVVELRDRKLVSHQGSFSEFWRRREEERRRERARPATRRRVRGAPSHCLAGPCTGVIWVGHVQPT